MPEPDRCYSRTADDVAVGIERQYHISNESGVVGDIVACHSALGVERSDQLAVSTIHDPPQLIAACGVDRAPAAHRPAISGVIPSCLTAEGEHGDLWITWSRVWADPDCLGFFWSLGVLRSDRRRQAEHQQGARDEEKRHLVEGSMHGISFR